MTTIADPEKRIKALEQQLAALEKRVQPLEVKDTPSSQPRIYRPPTRFKSMPNLSPRRPGF